MPIKGLYGEAIPEGSVGSRQVPANPTPITATPPIEVDRWARNGKPVDASFMNQVNTHANAAVLYRSKEVFSILGPLGVSGGLAANPTPMTSIAGTVPRWRFAFRTGVAMHALIARAVLLPPTSDFANDTHVTIRIYDDAAESNLVSTTEFHYGAGPAGVAQVGGWQYHRVVDKFIEGLDLDTEHFAVVSTENYGIIQSLAIGELNSLTEAYTGYLPCNITSETPITDRYREMLSQVLPQLWRKTPAKGPLNWTAYRQNLGLTFAAAQTTSATPTNLHDKVSTTVTASSAGITADMRLKERLSQLGTGIPVVIWVCGENQSGDGKGRWYLKNSSGTLATITNGWGTTPSWQKVEVLWPATLDKWDVHFDDNGSGDQFNVYAYSSYEYES